MRQAHYAAGDLVNQAQGKLYEASAEVGKLESEIRFVIEGRQRVEQRLATLKEQIGQWGTRREDAEAELETLSGQGEQAEEAAELLAAQVEEQAMRLPELEDALGQAQAAPTSSARVWARSSSRSRCWPPSSAASRSSRASSTSAVTAW